MESHALSLLGLYLLWRFDEDFHSDLSMKECREDVKLKSGQSSTRGDRQDRPDRFDLSYRIEALYIIHAPSLLEVSSHESRFKC